MADPKYANLPGIDVNQPDVYETSDLPEDDQAQFTPEELNSESVEKIGLDPSEAFNKFHGKSLVSGGTDFSDYVGRSRKTGYDIPRTEYEMLEESSRQKETPQQRYQRLQHEIRELGEDVTKIKESVKADSTSDAMSPVNLAKQVEYLQHQLGDLHLDKLLGTPGGINLADPQGVLQKRLMTEIQAFQSESSDQKEKPGTKASGDGSDQVTYQLYYRPEQAKFSNNARMADIEQRMERIEALLGNNPEKLSAVTADVDNKSLVGALGMLSTKTKLLDPSQLDQIEGRLHALGQTLGQIASKKEAVEQSEKQSKVAELYDLVKKWDSMANTLPHVVDRLSAVKDLHEQALQFSQALAHLDTAQQQISSSLQSHSDMLSQIDGTLTANMTSIKSNFESLDARLKPLKK